MRGSPLSMRLCACARDGADVSPSKGNFRSRLTGGSHEHPLSATIALSGPTTSIEFVTEDGLFLPVVGTSDLAEQFRTGPTENSSKEVRVIVEFRQRRKVRHE